IVVGAVEIRSGYEFGVLWPGDAEAWQGEQHFIAAPFSYQVERRSENTELNLAFLHRRQDARGIGVGMLHQFDVFLGVDFEPVQRKAQRRVWDRAERRPDMTGLSLQVINLLDALLRHDFVWEDIDPVADHNKLPRN